MKKFLFIIITSLCTCFSFAQKNKSFTTNDYVSALKQATEIMINDVTSPVAAGRYYAYITLAANEIYAAFDSSQPSFAKKLNGFEGTTVESSLVKHSNLSLSVILGVYKMSNKLLPSGYLMNQPIDSLLKLAHKKGISNEIISNSIALANEIVKQLAQYINQDGFRSLSGKKRFTPSAGDAYWQPTAPAFMQALEPYWNTLRTFVIDSSRQFTPITTVPYEADTTSQFYRLMFEVYTIGNKLSAQQAEIAMFWDCNPFALQQIGHLEFGVKKISPGGHWMGITGIACKKAKKHLSETVYIHAAVACAIADAFISCWDEKYRSNRIRPETAIKRLIDPLWHPLLQTPPFPEYTSGHSVISTTAAVVLTSFFGDKFSYTDDTETEFGLAPRKFSSFLGASQEAAISRLYGGIHYRDAVENGVIEGELIGRFIIPKLPAIRK